MRKTLLTALLLCLTLLPAVAVEIVNGQIPVTRLDVARNGDRMLLDMDLDVSALKLGRDRQITITPVLQNADSTECVVFPAFILAGHNLYFKHLRDEDLAGAALYREGRQQTIQYHGQADDAAWMDDALLKVNYAFGGCCSKVLARGVDPIAPMKTPRFKPVFNYISPVGDSVKTRELKKRSYIDFPLDKIEIYPDYRRNPIELVAITNTIDSVRDDKDVTITAISIKGFASPEGRYSHNTWLAQNRTLALKNYVNRLYNFAPDFIATDYESEDWEGLREYVVKSSLAHRDSILAIIDSDMEPDPKNERIKREYPEEYAFLLATVYPGLRHSDYKIDYTIRSFTSLEDILRVLHSEPQKLSLSEFYRAAQSMTPGSTEYNEVFETAVRMYPNDPVANLNAANTAMGRSDYAAAERYLSKAGDDASAIYARGILEALRENYEEALGYFEQAARLKVADAPAAIASVREILDYRNGAVQTLK